MSSKVGKILIGLGVPVTGLGLYIVNFETHRTFYIQNVAPGIAVTAVGIALLSIGVGKVVKPIAGVGAFVVFAGLAALLVYSNISKQLGLEKGYADREAIMRSLIPVCEGKAMANAAPRAATGPRKTMLIVKPSEGSSYEWGADLDPTWRPHSVEDTQLVACFYTEKRLIDSCSYTDASGKLGVSISSYQYFITAKIYEAKTAKVFAEKLFEGGKPMTGCADSIKLAKGERTSSREGAMPSQTDQLAFVRAQIDAK